ncbi:condensation domain-containing protein, partial [Mesorhizobium sp. GbtcB19]|uniref:condensation domain-containing protein n=1 Tax=Mesorhizobium sp. GbtcB19 TaxID=2824764 RepID=UPI0020C67A4B
VEAVPGGIANAQDIYALTPLQDGILFHHLLAQKGDPYLISAQMAFAERDRLDRYLSAVQRVVDRHEILRTPFVWEGLSSPVQVVWRHAPLSITEVELDPAAGPGVDQLRHRYDPSHYRLDLTNAPLLRFVVAKDPEADRWLLQELHHHLIGDQSTLELLNEEIEVILSGWETELPTAEPFRNVVAQARLGISAAEHEHYFRERLGDIDEPSLPFGLAEARGDGGGIVEAYRLLPQALNDRLRGHARRLGVSLASLCHVAWGQVVARTSGREKVVFGTVLLGRMQAGAGADRAIGLFINSLPLRLDLDGRSVAAGVREAHLRLAELLQHEHAPLALAQRCSGVAAGTPLISALLNYRHSTPERTGTPSLIGAEWLESKERTNYPLTLSVDDFGTALGLTAQVVEAVSADRVIGLMQRALASLAEALEAAPEMPLRSLDVLPAEERRLILETWNRTEAAYSSDHWVHELFEEQARRNPNAMAVVQGTSTLTYGELIARANRLAQRLIGL